MHPQSPECLWRLTSDVCKTCRSAQQAADVAKARVGGVAHHLEQGHFDIAQVNAGRSHALEGNVAIEGRARRDGIGNDVHLKIILRQRGRGLPHAHVRDRKSTRLNSSHVAISYAVFCLKKKKTSKIS